MEEVSKLKRNENLIRVIDNYFDDRMSWMIEHYGTTDETNFPSIDITETCLYLKNDIGWGVPEIFGRVYYISLIEGTVKLVNEKNKSIHWRFYLTTRKRAEILDYVEEKYLKEDELKEIDQKFVELLTSKLSKENERK